MTHEIKSFSLFLGFSLCSLYLDEHNSYIIILLKYRILKYKCIYIYKLINFSKIKHICVFSTKINERTITRLPTPFSALFPLMGNSHMTTKNIDYFWLCTFLEANIKISILWCLNSFIQHYIGEAHNVA